MTKDEILSMAKEAGIGILYEYDGPDHAGVCDWKDIERFAALVAEKEREACAKVCDEIDDSHWGCEVKASWCSREIRARGNP
jgi:hypothetical protein